MPEFMIHDGSGVRVVKVPRWVMILTAVGVMLFGALLLMLAAGFALVVLPVAIIGAGIAGWFARRRGARVYREHWARTEEGPRGETTVIEGDYQVIERKKDG